MDLLHHLFAQSWEEQEKNYNKLKLFLVSLWILFRVMEFFLLLGITQKINSLKNKNQKDRRNRGDPEDTDLFYRKFYN